MITSVPTARAGSEAHAPAPISQDATAPSTNPGRLAVIVASGRFPDERSPAAGHRCQDRPLKTRRRYNSMIDPRAGVSGDPVLVCHSHLRWDWVYQRPQHLLSRLARHWPVIVEEE